MECVAKHPLVRVVKSNTWEEDIHSSLCQLPIYLTSVTFTDSKTSISTKPIDSSQLGQQAVRSEVSKAVFHVTKSSNGAIHTHE